MQLPLSITASTSQLFSNFIVPDDAQPVEALQNYDTSPSQIFFIYGAEQTGKSHLLNALCIDQGNAVDYMFIDATTLYEMFSQLRLDEGETPNILDGLEHSALICIDNIDALLQFPQWQFALFDLINRILETGNNIVLTSRLRYDDPAFTLPDLSSRLSWGESIFLSSLSDENLLDLVKTYIEQKQISYQPAAISYLMHHMTRQPRVLKEAIDALDLFGLSQKRRLTVPLIKEWMHMGRP